MVAVAAEGPIRADAVPAAVGRVDAAGNGGEEEVGEFKSDVRKLEELFKKLNPSAEEFVPLSRRRGDGARRLSADAPVFVSPAIDYYAHHPVQQQQQQMHVLQLVGAGGGGGGRDSSSDGSANGQPNRRKRNCFNQGRRMGGRPRRADREYNVRRTIYVSDIDQHVTEQKLAEVFSNCGQVVDCRICGDPNSMLRFAFIEFADDVGARAALALGGTMLGYYPVRVLPSKTAILPVNPKFLPRTEDEKEMVSRTVYCTNIDKNVGENAVKNFFEGMCGEVARLRLLGDDVHSTCIAFVEFVQNPIWSKSSQNRNKRNRNSPTKAESAILALNCSGMVIGSLPVRVSPSKTPVRPVRLMCRHTRACLFQL